MSDTLDDHLFFMTEEFLDRDSEPVEIEFERILQETDLAWQIMIDMFTVKWFPKSRCVIEDNIIYVPEWLAIEKI